MLPDCAILKAVVKIYMQQRMGLRSMIKVRGFVIGKEDEGTACYPDPVGIRSNLPCYLIMQQNNAACKRFTGNKY